LATLTRPETSRAPRPNIGNYADEQAALEAVVARLVAELDPHAIWLFGSRARGTHRPDSDFDLLVVAKENGRFGSNDYVKAYRAAVGLGVDCEVVPCSHEDFEDALTTHTSFVSQIVAHGREVYSAPAMLPGSAIISNAVEHPSLRGAQRRSNPDAASGYGEDVVACDNRPLDCFASLAMTDRQPPSTSSDTHLK
jgi:uncharacterized protein